MEELQPEYTSGQWRLFIDSSKVSWKAVLLHHGNTTSVPLAHAVHMQEMWENLQGLLQKIRYEYHRWNVCAELKVTAMVTVLQDRFTKFCCF
jgi:hypothetical protein